MSKFKYNPGDLVGPSKSLLLERTYKGKDGHWFGKFRCSYCNEHKIFETQISSVATGNTNSCGCYNKQVLHENGKKKMKNIAGQKFGKLTAIKFTGKQTSTGSCIWLCQCDCKNKGYKEVSQSDLQSGRVKSCGCNYSKGEAKIESLLRQLKIDYKTQAVFEKCVSETNTKLRFDFYLPEYNCCIEYNGEQHYLYKNAGWNTKEHFIITQKHDKIKQEYCSNNHIKLVIIPYWDFDKIDIKYIIEKCLEGEKMSNYVYSEKAQAVLSYLQANQSADLMATDIAAATGIETKSITGVLNGLQKKGLVQRVEKEGFEKKVVQLTAEGAAVDPREEKPEPEKAAAN